MKHLKLFAALALTAAMTVSLAGCQGKAASSPDAGTQQPQTPAKQIPTDQLPVKPAQKPRLTARLPLAAVQSLSR